MFRGRGGGGAAICADELAVAVEPPTSAIDVVIPNVPAFAYVWMPVTSKPPPGVAGTEPAEAVRSPQAIWPLSSPACPPGLASWKWATTPPSAWPAVPETLRPVAVRGASWTVAWNVAIWTPPNWVHVYEIVPL